MKQFLPALCASLLPMTALFSETTPAEPGTIKVLIVDGFSNHDWRATTQTLLGLLKKDDRFSVEVSTVPDESSAAWSQWLPAFGNYDVIVQNTNDINSNHSWPAPARKALETYLANGGGMLVFHSANNAFPDWVEYNRMIGLGWRDREFGEAIIVENGMPVRIPAGQGEGTSHGKRLDILVTRLGDHPIHAGLPRQWMAADLEVYRYARGPAENMKVLSHAKDPKTGLDFPIEWVVSYGDGRVYNSTYGHYWHKEPEAPPGARCAAFQTLFLRAMRWLGRAGIEPGVPEAFPSTEQISLYSIEPPEH